jgi:hypothetical protein
VIIICPFAQVPELVLPDRIWCPIVQMLRGYGLPVCLLGHCGQWMDACGFAENEILSELPMEQKLAALENATLVVGIPNTWTLACTQWEKKIIYLYPDDQDPHKWWDQASPNYGRLLYTTGGIQVSILLAGVRELIKVL